METSTSGSCLCTISEILCNNSSIEVYCSVVTSICCFNKLTVAFFTFGNVFVPCSISAAQCAQSSPFNVT